MRFFLFDRVVAAQRGKHISAVKHVDLMGDYFESHYPRRPVLPATLLVESLAQLGGMLNILNHDFAVEMVLALVDGVHLRRPVHQGERLDLEMTMLYDHPYGATMKGTIHSAGELVGSADRIVFAHDRLTDPAAIQRNRDRFHYQSGGFDPEGGGRP